MLNGVHRHPKQDEVIYGRPATEALSDTASAYGAGRLLIVTTRSLAGHGGLADQLATALGNACAGVFSGVRAHSPRQAVVDGANRARELACDLLVALGGGSVIDATKVMQLCLWTGVQRAEQLDAYRMGAGSSAIEPGVRMVAIPTTLSAAEFTPFAGVTDTVRQTKEGYFHPLFAPRKVVLDPRMTLSTPLELWSSTGMKAVDHAVEQLCNPERAPFSDALAEAGLSRLARSLVKCKEDPGDLDARQDCQFGMWLSISGATMGRRMGASHAIGHSLGGMLGVPHGMTSAVTLPAVLRWNESALGDRGRRIAELMGSSSATAADAVRELCEKLSLPTSLESVGVGAERFRAIAEHAFHDGSIRGNPRPIKSPEDIEEILKLAR
jgi:maleylacetate reductase